MKMFKVGQIVRIIATPKELKRIFTNYPFSGCKAEIIKVLCSYSKRDSYHLQVKIIEGKYKGLIASVQNHNVKIIGDNKNE